MDWKKHKGAFHLTTRLPDLIRQMTSPEDDIRQEARDQVYEEIFHQGTIYAATPHVIPFMIDMLRQDSTPDPADLLIMLWNMVESCCRTPAQERMGSRYMRLCAETYSRVAAGYPIYVRHLVHSDPQVRFWVVILLSTLPEYAPQTRRIFRRVLVSEANSLIKAAALYGIGKLTPEGYRHHTFTARTAYQTFFECYMGESQDRVVQLAAASAWIQVKARHIAHSNELPPRLLPILADALASPIKADDMYYLEFAYPSTVIENAAKLGIAALIDLMGRPELNAFQVHCLARELLEKTFGHPHSWGDYGGWWRDVPPETMIYKSLNPPLESTKQRVLSAIVNNDRFWELPTNLFSFFYDLPDDREALRLYL